MSDVVVRVGNSFVSQLTGVAYPFIPGTEGAKNTAHAECQRAVDAIIYTQMAQGVPPNADLAVRRHLTGFRGSTG